MAAQQEQRVYKSLSPQGGIITGLAFERKLNSGLSSVFLSFVGHVSEPGDNAIGQLAA